jgi:hypothetical protein
MTRTLLPILIIVSLLIRGLPVSAVAAQTAPAPDYERVGNGLLFWHGNTDQRTEAFSVGQPINDLWGRLSREVACDPLSNADTLLTSSDAYIVPSGTITRDTGIYDLTTPDVQPVAITTVGTTFSEESIGIADKGWSGSFAIVLDHCQDTKLQREDYVLDPAFTIKPPVGNGAYQNKWENLSQEQKDLYKFSYWTWLGLAGYVAAVVLLAEAREASKLTAEKWFVRSVILGGVTAFLYRATYTFYLQANSYLHLSKDPPDPNYRQLSPLPLREVSDLASDDPLLIALTDVATSASNQAAILEAMLHSIERFDGADEAGLAEWQLIHARAIRDEIDLLTLELARSNASLDQLDDALAADDRLFDEMAVEFETARAEIVEAGFSTDQRRELRNIGRSDAEIDDLEQDLSTRSFAFNKSDFRATLDELRNTNTTLASELETTAADVDVII